MAQPLPLISVIMPVFNGARYLHRSVGSVLRQTCTEWELVAVDDGSTDDSFDQLRQLAESDARIRCFQMPENRGVAAARNRALREARGELIAYLDMDDEYYPDYLSQVQAHRYEADVLVFAYDLAEERPDAANFGKTFTWEPGQVRHRLLQQHIAVPLGVAHVRRLLDRTGMFVEDLRVEEDTDLWQRFSRAPGLASPILQRGAGYTTSGPRVYPGPEVRPTAFALGG